jgi:DNA-3-methyladenine glycosylase
VPCGFMARKIGRDFYIREDTLAVATELLGKRLVVPDGAERVAGRIVEAEAYLGEIDRAAHSFGGRRTARTETMYGRGGTVYVFFVYGMHYQLNAVTGPPDHPHAVLIRAVEPEDGIDVMRRRRGPMKDVNLTSGPGKLCAAFGIDRSFNGEDLSGTRIWIEDAPPPNADEIAAGPRVGVDYAGEYALKPWRFWIKGNAFVTPGKR